MKSISDSVKELATRQGLDLEKLRNLNDALEANEDISVRDGQLVVQSGRTSEALNSFAKKHFPDLAEGVDPSTAQKKAISKATASKLSLTRQAALPKQR